MPEIKAAEKSVRSEISNAEKSVFSEACRVQTVIR